MIKQWMYTNKRSEFKNLDSAGNDLGFVYAARIDVVQGFTLLKIGATRTPAIRFYNFGKKATLFCVSPSHLNFWENEEILHEVFAEYRVPKRPNQGSQAEFFNISMPYFLSHLPLLKYSQK